MQKHQILLIFGLIMLSACVTTQAVRLGGGPVRPPVPPDKVFIYRTADQVPGKYEEVALLSAKGDSLWTDEEDMYDELRKKAGKLGANAIILDAMSEPSQTAQVITGVLFGVGGNRQGKALAIYVLPEQKK